MRPVDARSLEDGRSFEADVGVVGGGAAGITLALTLAERGADVLLVEAGGTLPEPATQALHDIESVGHPFRPNYINRARWLGGSCNLWAGRCMRLLPDDLAGRPWIAGSAWPIPYDELARWYPTAGEMLALAPDAFAPERYVPELGAVERALVTDDRLTPTVSLWASGPMRFAAAYRRRLERAASLRVLLNANAVGLDLDDGGASVERLRLATLDGRRLAVRARRLVLACGGIENARLLLLPGARQPRGIGNDHDQVGRCFMEHPRAVFGRVVLRPGARLSHLRGRALRHGRMQLGLALSPAEQARQGLLNHYLTLEPEVSGYTAQAYETTVDVLKVLMRRGHVGRRTDFSSLGRGHVEGLIYQLSPKEILPQWAFVLHDRLHRLMPPPEGPQRFAVVTFCEQPPDPESRVTLGDRRDALGLPQARVDWRIGADVHRSLFRLHETLGAVLLERGLGTLEPGDPDRLAYTDASHHMGTTRMSLDPHHGVVDPDCRVHGIRNLWIAGSSVFPSAGHANPTLTIVTLALRLADRLAAA